LRSRANRCALHDAAACAPPVLPNAFMRFG
jgi:hypothetical protein